MLTAAIKRFGSRDFLVPGGFRYASRPVPNAAVAAMLWDNRQNHYRYTTNFRNHVRIDVRDGLPGHLSLLYPQSR